MTFGNPFTKDFINLLNYLEFSNKDGLCYSINLKINFIEYELLRKSSKLCENLGYGKLLFID
jgi:hypothetical protein